MIVGKSCPKCDGDMEGEYRGLLASIINLKRTNIISCTNCNHVIDIDSWKNQLLPQGVDIPE